MTCHHCWRFLAIFDDELIVSVAVRLKTYKPYCCQETLGLIVGLVAGNDAHLPRCVSVNLSCTVIYCKGGGVGGIEFTTQFYGLCLISLCCHPNIHPWHQF